jgi:hypothetical protein
MVKFVGILVLTTNLNVGVEPSKGFVEKSFPNSRAGAELLVEFTESVVGVPENGIHIVVRWLRDEDEDKHKHKHIIELLRELEIKYGLSGSEQVRAAVAENHLPERSAAAVALAFKKRWAFLWGERPQKSPTIHAAEHVAHE